jgi:hypothetical protein
MNKYFKIALIGISIIVSILIYRHYSNNLNEYDLKELKTLNGKIIWNKNTKLKWSDFKFDPNEKSFTIYAKVGLVVRYNAHSPILFRSNTTLSPTESIVSDTTNTGFLRIAQARFDLLETYRQKMELEVESLKQLESSNLEPDDFDKMIDRYYSNFEKEWESFIPFSDNSLLKIEEQIKNRLK